MRWGLYAEFHLGKLQIKSIAGPKHFTIASWRYL